MGGLGMMGMGGLGTSICFFCLNTSNSLGYCIFMLLTFLTVSITILFSPLQVAWAWEVSDMEDSEA